MMYGSKSKYTIIFIFALAFFTSLPLEAQKERKYTRQGNRDYAEKKYEESEILYRRAIDVDPSFNKALFNLGDVLYKQEKYEEAIDNFEQLSEKEFDKENLSASYYNLGNSLLKSGKIEESIEAYKNALRNDPDNMEAKYNLAYAQDLLEKQQQQQQQQQNKNQQDQDKDQQNDQKQDSDQDNQEQEEQQQQEQENQQQQQQQQQMSREDAERLLQALAENEKEVQEKVKKTKAAKARVRILKNW
ncbi:MAG: tetratricopeptide repeat protein [Bacteroidota bacterium]|nr:tetratricopeptide repeat protein [Bacteroidota bacterium]